MPREPQDCGRTGFTLALYLISAQSVEALSTGFNLLRCGYFPASFDPDSVRMLLCDTCALNCGFPKAEGSAAHSGRLLFSV